MLIGESAFEDVVHGPREEPFPGRRQRLGKMRRLSSLEERAKNSGDIEPVLHERRERRRIRFGHGDDGLARLVQIAFHQQGAAVAEVVNAVEPSAGE